MNRAVVAIGKPQFFFIMSQRNAMRGTTMALHIAFLEPLHFNVIQLLSRLDVAYFNSDVITAVNLHTHDSYSHDIVFCAYSGATLGKS